MAKKHLQDYEKYFEADNQGLWIDPEILEKRKELSKYKSDGIWTLLRLFLGNGNQEDVSRFEDEVFPYQEMRRKFQKERHVLFAIVEKRDGRFCRNCKTTHGLSVDHIVALVNGGTNDPDNLQILCKSCNSRKGSR